MQQNHIVCERLVTRCSEQCHLGVLLKFYVLQVERKLFKKFFHKVGMGGWNTPVSSGHTQVEGSWCPAHRSFIIRWGQPWEAESSGFLEEQEEWFLGAPPFSISFPSLRLPVCLLTWIKSSSLSSVSSVHGWLELFFWNTCDSSFLISYLRSPSLTMGLETDPGETSGGPLIWWSGEEMGSWVVWSTMKRLSSVKGKGAHNALFSCSQELNWCKSSNVWM